MNSIPLQCLFFGKVMINVFSVIIGSIDIIDQSIAEVIEGNITQIPKQETLQKIARKIDDTLHFFLQSNSVPDGHYTKHLDWPIYEFRISIPCSSYFLRIFFALERDQLILLTSYLIKPKEYTDKKNSRKIDVEYDEKIQTSKKIYADFSSPKWQQFNYKKII